LSRKSPRRWLDLVGEWRSGGGGWRENLKRRERMWKQIKRRDRMEGATSRGPLLAERESSSLSASHMGTGGKGHSNGLGRQFSPIVPELQWHKDARTCVPLCVPLDARKR
jgi:hypothetical protein